MISKLPRWVWSGASALALIAGMINAVGFLGFKHGITHLTGTTTMVGVSIAQGDASSMFHLLAIIISFVTGATLSGFIIRDSALHLDPRYGMALVIESALLFCAVPLLRQQNPIGIYLASTACGLQNAMVSTYSGAVLRTTHVSGIFTDLGIFFGHLLRQTAVDWRRFWLWIAIAGSFFLGGITGGMLFLRMSYKTLYFPAALTGIVGLISGIYLKRKLSGKTAP